MNPPTMTVERTSSHVEMIFSACMRDRMKELTGMFNRSPVIMPGAYFFMTSVASRCGKMAFTIMDPKKPVIIHFANSLCGHIR